jgi:hypothetical protein
MESRALLRPADADRSARRLPFTALADTREVGVATRARDDAAGAPGMAVPDPETQPNRVLDAKTPEVHTHLGCRIEHLFDVGGATQTLRAPDPWEGWLTAAVVSDQVAQHLCQRQFPVSGLEPCVIRSNGSWRGEDPVSRL